MAFGYLQSQIELLQFLASSSGNAGKKVASSSSAAMPSEIIERLVVLHKKVVQASKHWIRANSDPQGWVLEYETFYHEFTQITKALQLPTPALAPGLVAK